MSELGKYELPRGWRWATIPELVGNDGVFIDGDWVESKDQDPDGNVRLIQLADVGDGVYRDKSHRFMTKARAEELRCTFLQEGDVLIARMPDPLGRACIFPGDDKPSVTVVDVAIARSGNGAFDHRWLASFVNAHPFRAAVARLQAGSTRKRISRGNLATIPLPVPPLPEQRRIVAEIEKQFTRLDAGVAALRRTQSNLKRYRAAVLKAACEGRLVPTEAELARKERRNFETGEVLLSHVLTERRKNWQGRGPYEEPALPSTDILPELPKGWAVASLEAIADIIDPNPSHRMPKYVPDGIPLVSSENFVGTEGIDFSIGKQVTRETLKQQQSRYSISQGDFVLSRIGTIGKTRFLPTEREYCLSHALVVLKVRSSSISKRWLRKTIASESILSQAHKGVQSVGVPDLGMGKIRNFVIPIPPLAEQTRIVAEVERRLSVVVELEAAVNANLQRATRLRQSILQRAFSEKLDPS